MAKKQQAPDYNLEIGEHPAQLRVDGQPMFKDGKPVPLFPNQKSVRLNGQVIAYVNEKHKVLFIVPESKLGVIAQEAIELVKKELGDGGSHMIAEPVVEIEEEDECDDDE